MATKRGTSGPDTISFTGLGASNDTGYGFDGDDKLYGGGGGDLWGVGYRVDGKIHGFVVSGDNPADQIFGY